MKRIIGAILIVALICNLTSISFAASDAAAYYSVPVEYSDHPGQIEKLRFMVQGENAYVDARALAERLGYSYNESGAVVTVYNLDPDSALPCSATVFQSGSTQVSHMVYCKFNEQYQAPFATVQNDQGTWIPFFYALRMFNSGAVQTEETLLIDIPTKNILDLYFQIALHATTYLFDWADDFGYSGFDQQVLGICGHVTNVCNGLLEFDGASWATMFQQFTGHKAAYDEKYGEELAMLLCTEADKELQETAEQIERYLDLLNEDGTLGRLLSQTSMLLDKDITTLYQQCETILKNIQAGNSPLLSYNRSYQALELALDRQTWFSKTGGTILEVQSGVSSAVGNAFTFLDIGLKMGEVAGYAMEFQKHDDFALSALTYYLDHVAKEVALPPAMQESLCDYAEILSADLGSYMVKRFKENVGKWIIDALPGEKLLGLQGEALRFSWDLASNTIPFLSNGLSAADNYELALYGQLLQFNAYHSFLSKRDQVLGADEVTPEAIYETAQLCYVFLKSCYLTREAALASLVNKPQSVKEQIQPLIDYQNDINQEIAQLLVQLKKAEKTNKRGVYGFLPADNQAFLKNYQDGALIAWMEAKSSAERLVTDAYQKSVGNWEYSIPQINLSGEDVAAVNADIWETFYEGIVIERLRWLEQGNIDTVGWDTIDYQWSVHADVLSLIIHRMPDNLDMHEYFVYNVSVSTGKLLSKEDIFSYAGVSQSEYRSLALRGLRGTFSHLWGGYCDQVGFDDFFEEQYFNTVSEENIEHCSPYFNEQGQLCMIGRIYSSAGASFYYFQINLEEPLPSTTVDKYFEMQPSSPQEPTWQTQFQSVLAEYPENDGMSKPQYVLYDVDKDGLPELFVCQGLGEYHIYSFYQEQLVESDAQFWTYNEAIYAQDGNGILVHDGGYGSTRLEYIHRFELEEGKIRYIETLKSTEDCSSEDLYAVLKSLTPIGPYYPVNDYSGFDLWE